MQPRLISLFRQLGRLFAFATVVVALFLVATIGVLATTQVKAPQSARLALEEFLNSVLGEQGQISIGDVSIAVHLRRLEPQIRIEEIQVTGLLAGRSISVEEIDIGVELRPILGGTIKPKAIAARGVGIGASAETAGAGQKVAGLPDQDRQPRPDPALAAISSAFQFMAGTDLERMTVTRASFAAGDPDLGAGLTGGWLSMVGIGDGIQVVGGAALTRDGAIAGDVGIDGKYDTGSGVTKFTADITGVEAAEILELLPVNAGGPLVEAQVGASIEIEFDRAGRLGNITGSIAMGEGRLHVPGRLDPLAVSSINAEMTYQSDAGRIMISGLSLVSEAGAGKGEGLLYLIDDGEAGPRIAGQLELHELSVTDTSLFDSPLTGLSASVTFETDLQPFHFRFTRFSLTSGSAALNAEGEVGLDAGSWFANLRFDTDQLDRDGLLAHWPKRLASRPRAWVLTGLPHGNFSSIAGETAYSASLGWQAHVNFLFADATIKFMTTLPPAVNVSGFGMISSQRAAIAFERGSVVVPDVGEVDISGSDLLIPDIWEARNPSRIRLQISGSLQATMALLDFPPFRFLEKAGLGQSLVAGFASGYATIRLPLLKKLKHKDVEFSAGGNFTNVLSTSLLRGVELRADRLAVWANNEEVTVSGSGSINGIAGSGKWRQGFSGPEKSASLLIGKISLSRRLLEEFKIMQSAGILQQAHDADYFVSFSPGAPAQFGISTDVAKLGIELPFLDLQAGAGQPAEFLIEGRIGDVPEITRVLISGNELDAEGRLVAGADGQPGVIQFANVEIGEWFSAPVQLASGPDGRIGVALMGGVIDLTKLEGNNFGHSVGSGFDIPVSVNLDRLIITPDISLTELVGRISFKGAESEKLTGRINGGQLVGIETARTANGLGAYIVTQDAGAAMRDARVVNNLYGGTLEISLLPKAAVGSYEGQLLIKNAKIRNMPTLSEILSYVSIVGLLENLVAQGISFTEIEAEFEMTRDKFILKEGVAVGPSIGIKMAGAFDTRQSVLDLKGIITPFNPLNEVVRQTPLRILGLEKGAGLGGVSFFVKGPTDRLKVGANPLTVVTPGIFQEIFD